MKSNGYLPEDSSGPSLCGVYRTLQGEPAHAVFPKLDDLGTPLRARVRTRFQGKPLRKMLSQQGRLSFPRGLALECIPDTLPNSPRPWLLPHTYLSPPTPQSDISTKQAKPSESNAVC